MQAIKRTLWGILVGVSLLWYAADQSNLLALRGIFEWRNVLNQYTGMLAISLMSIAMLLAVRPVVLESRLNGLDKMYRLHKWLGIGALTLSISHWLIANGPKWAVSLGWLERRGRPPRPRLLEGSLEQIFSSQRGLAESIGEWAFYLAALLMVLALIKRFPYRHFFQTHRVLALCYLALVFHSVILFKFAYWPSPAGVVLAILLTLGSVAAVLCLLRKHPDRRPVNGVIKALDWQAASQVLTLDIALDAGWAGHQAGQFAFIRLDKSEGPHPFTIASAWQGDGHLRFLIKALGDYTRSLHQHCKVGDRVQIEGPYGCFTFAGSGAEQIWVSGGIGFTPFLARLQTLAGQTSGIHWFHCVEKIGAEEALDLQRQAEKSGVQLHLYSGQRLKPADVLATVRQIANADVWFCGPTAFAQSLRSSLLAQGLPAKQFHQELFEMR